MNRGAWRTTVGVVTKVSDTAQQLNNNNKKPKAMLPYARLSNTLSELTLCGAKRSLQLSPKASPHNSSLIVLS